MRQLVNPRTLMIASASPSHRLDLRALFPYHHLNENLCVEDLHAENWLHQLHMFHRFESVKHYLRSILVFSVFYSGCLRYYIQKCQYLKIRFRKKTFIALLKIIAYVYNFARFIDRKR